MDLWYGITLAGGPEIWTFSTLLVLLAYFLFKKKLKPGQKALFKKFAAIYIISILFAVATVLVLKNALQTDRPCIPCIFQFTDCNPYCLSDNAFPSGHAATIFAAFMPVWLVLRKRWTYPLFLIPFLVASSRYFLHVHRIVDILAGACIGIAIPIIALKIYEKKPKILSFLY